MKQIIQRVQLPKDASSDIENGQDFILIVCVKCNQLKLYV